MKQILPNPTNISIAVVYCLFGAFSFFVLKIAAKYFMRQQKSQISSKNQVNDKKISRKYLNAVNFSKVFLKTYFFKNTLIGSIFNKDKKYLLKQIFILSCIAVSCFNINTYIMWPWAIGLAMSVTTFVISQIIVPMISKPSEQIKIVDQSQMASNLNQPSSMGSIEIEINTRLEIILSTHREETISRKIKQKPKEQKKEKSPNLQLLFIMILAFISEILISVCIVKLSLSVSNSGMLNLISFGIGVMIDQVGARIGIGFISYTVCLGLHKSKVVNIFENNIFYQCCSQAIAQDLRRVHEEAQVQTRNNKVANQNAFVAKNLNDTGGKMIQQNEFSCHEQVNSEIAIQNSVKSQDQAVLEEQDESDEEQDQAEMPQVQPKVQNVLKEQQKEIFKDETKYFELYTHDIETFTEQMSTTEIQTDKMKKFKKRVVKQEQKFKSDPLLYLPFEEHKLSSHRNSMKHEMKEFENQLSLFEKEKTSVSDNFLKHIQVLYCVDDSIVTEEEAEIGTVLNEKNLNIKTLTINEKAYIPPTYRPTHSATKRSFSKESIGVKKVKKVSPYLVDLQSQAIRPQKSKSKKLMVSKVNKENANQTNQSFMPLQTIEVSRVTQNNLRIR